MYDAPRQLVQISTRYAPVEMAQSRAGGFCCGGGGGMSFIDEPADKRVNQERAGKFWKPTPTSWRSAARSA